MSSSRPPRAVLASLHAGVAERARVAYAAGLAGPGASRGARFLWGFCLPFHVARAVARDRPTRGRYTHVVAVQATVALAFPFIAVVANLQRWVHELRAGGDRAELVAGILSTLLASAAAAEWTVVAFSREYHDELSARAAFLTGAPGEPLQAHPRIHLDFGWLVTKVKRRVREALLLASALPLIAICMAIPIPLVHSNHLGIDVDDAVSAVLSGAWAVYWLAVFAIANAPAAWSDASPPPPWYARVLYALAPVPLLGAAARLYGRVWARVTRSVHPACAAFEAAPYEAAGLALARLLAGLPGIYLVSRPLFPVAAAHALRVRGYPR